MWLDCLKRFDVRYMDFEEKQMFVQDVLTKLDVLEATGECVEVVKEVTPGFGLDSE